MSINQENNRSNPTYDRAHDAEHKSKLEKVGDKIKSAFGASGEPDDSGEHADYHHTSGSPRIQERFSGNNRVSDDFDASADTRGSTSHGSSDDTGRPSLFESSGIPLGAAGTRKESVGKDTGMTHGHKPSMSEGTAFGMSKSDHDSAMTEGKTLGSAGNQYGDAGAGPHYAYQTPGDEFVTTGRTSDIDPPRSVGSDYMEDPYFNERSEITGTDNGFGKPRREEEKEFGSSRRGFGVTGGGGDSYGSGYIE